MMSVMILNTKDCDIREIVVRWVMVNVVKVNSNATSLTHAAHFGIKHAQFCLFGFAQLFSPRHTLETREHIMPGITGELQRLKIKGTLSVSPVYHVVRCRTDTA